MGTCTRDCECSTGAGEHTRRESVDGRVSGVGDGDGEGRVQGAMAREACISKALILPHVGSTASADGKWRRYTRER